MVENNLGRNITFPIYNSNVNNLVMHKATVETSVMSLGDKITGDVYYANNSLQVTMQEYIVYNNVHYILVNPPTIIREGMVVDNGDLRGMTKYSFEFYHPMYVLGNFPFSDVAVSQDEKQYLSENKSFSWIGKPQDFIDKINKNLEGTEWIVVKSENFPADTEDELSDVLTFDNNTIADALKIGYETWGLPYIVDQIREDEQGFSSEKKFKVIFGLPSNVIKNGQDEYVFRMGQGVGLKNNSRTPRNNKIVTRIAGYGSENNIPYGYPQIQWYGESNAKFTYGDHAGVYDNVTIGGRTFAKFVSYPIYDGIVGGQNVKLIKHPFTRNHLMPSVYRQELFNKVSPYLSDGSINSYYDPDIELVDYYDANTDSYPNQINLSSPSYEIHQFEDIKPELCEAKIVGVQPINNDGTDADGWDDTMDDDGNYLQRYFKITLPQLDFDLYACAAITEEMQINMRGGACIGCTFPVQVDWDDYKKNFYDDQGKFAPNGAQRNLTKYPKSNSGRITLILQKDNNTFGTLMPNIYQQPKGETTSGANDGDEFVILGISLPDTYVTNAEGRLDSEMKAYMLANNIYYYDYPLKFDEYFLATHTNILSQIRTNTQVKFQFANEDPMTLFVKQIVIKYGDNVLPQYDITLTDSVEVVLNQIGQVADSVEKLSTLVSVLRQSYNRNVWGEIAKKLSKTINDTAQGEITFAQGLKIGSNGNNGIAPNGDATLNDVNVNGDITITHVETPQGGESIVKEYGITNDGDISGEGLTLGDYSEGLLGTGGVFKIIDGKSYLEADKLYVRMKAYFDTLEIRRYIHSGGNRVASAAGCKLSRVVDSSSGSFYRLCFKATDGENTVTNDFTVGDFAYCHTTNLEGGELNQQNYWRLVMRYGSLNASRQIVSLNGEPVSGVEDTVVTEHFIDVANTTDVVDIGEEENYQGMMVGSTKPKAEDDVVQLGHAFDEDRQGAIIEAVTGAAQAPTYRIYQGINSFNLENKCKVDMGYDLTTRRAYLNVFGDFYVGDENESTYVKYEQAHNFGTNANPVYNPLLSIKARIEAASTIGNTSIDQYVGTATQTLIDGKNAVYTINGVAMTQSGPDYKAGDIWILPNAIGNYPAGTILVANSDRTIDGVNSHNINKWDKKDSYTDDSAFNGYISRLTAGTLINNPSDAQAITNILNVLKGSLESQTTIDGGLVLTSLIAMRNSDDNVTAGLCGDDQDNEIAAWFGGIQKDYEKLTDAQKSQGWNVQKWAKSLFRFDGSGYLAGGDISWTDEGDTTVKGTIKADNFFHAVCHYLEYGLPGIYYGSVLYYYDENLVPSDDNPNEPPYSYFDTGSYYTAEEIYSLSRGAFSSVPDGFIATTGKADIVMCAPNPQNNWRTIDGYSPYVTLPKPEDFQGKVVEVGGFCYGTGASGEPTVMTFEVHCVCGDLNPRDTRMTLLVWLDSQNGLTTTSLSNKVTISTGGVARFLSVQLADLRWVWVLLANQTGGDIYINGGGGGSGGGSVTSIGLRVPDGFAISAQNNPITSSGYFDIIFARGSLSNGLVLATPSSGNNAPSWRALVAADIPNLDWSKITSGTPTNLSGYGIVDAKIENGEITLGNQTITPLTQHQSLADYLTRQEALDTFVLTSALAGYVTTDTEQTISGLKTFSSNVQLGAGTAVKAYDKGTDLLAYKSGTWGGVTGEHWFVGAAGVDGFIRSNGALERWVNNDTRYTIWDASNFTPSALKVKDVQVVDDNSLVINGEDVIYGAVLASNGMLTLNRTRLSIYVPEYTSDLVNDSGFIDQTGGTIESLTVTNDLDADSITVGSLVNSNTLAEYLDSDAMQTWLQQQGYITQTTADGRYIKGVSVYGSSLNPDTNRVVNIPYADINTPGVIQIGTGLVNDNEGHTTVDTSVIASRSWANGQFVTALGVSGDNLTYTKNGAATNITVPFATRTMGFKRLNVTGSQIADANTRTVDGVTYALLSNYASTDLWANMPSGMSWGNVLQLASATSLDGQLAWDSNHGVTTGVTRKLYWRSRNSSGWGTNGWHTIAFEDWVTTQINNLGDNLQSYITTQLGGYLPLTAGGSTPLTGSLYWNVANQTDNLIISNNKIQLSVSGTPHNIVLFEDSTASLTSYAKFYERPMVKTGTNNGTPVYTNVALVSEVEAKQNTIHFFNTKNSNTEVSFSNIYLPLNYQGGGTVYLDLSDYATTSALSGYLPLTAGSSKPLTGNIAYKGTKATYDMITFIDNVGDIYGNGIAIGGGGATIIGGGESAGTMSAQVSGGSEVMYIGNDQGVSIFTNLQNGWDYRKEFTFYNTGVLSTAGSVITPNGSGLYIEDTGGTERVAVFVNGSNQFFVGFGMRNAGYTGYFDSYVMRLRSGASGTTMTLDASNNVGIGTTNPQAKLHVDGNVRISGTLTGVTNIDGLMIFDATNNKVTVGTLDVTTLGMTSISVGESGYKMSISSNDNAVTFDVEDVGDYVFGYGNSRGNIYAGDGDFTGNVGIGTAATPSYKLKVQGASLLNGLVGIGTTPVQGHALDVDGSIYASSSVHADSFVNNSDIRMKDVTRFIEPSVHDIAIAPIIEFAWKKGDGSKNIGSIAQYWQTVFPQAVHADGSGILSMEYGNIALASAITAARHSLDNERRIAELELRVAELESLISG